MFKSQSVERSWLNQPFDSHRANIGKAAFIITTCALSIIAAFYAPSFNLSIASIFGGLMGASVLGAILCHFKAKKIGYENAWFIVLASLIAIVGLQGTLLNQIYTPGVLTSVFLGICGAGFTLATAGIIDRMIKESEGKKILLERLINCQNGDFIKENLDYLSKEEAEKLLQEACELKNNTLVMALMEKGYGDQEIFANALIRTKFENPELALALLDQGFVTDGHEDMWLSHIQDKNGFDQVKQVLLQKRENRINQIVNSTNKEVILSELEKLPSWSSNKEFRKKVIEGSEILKDIIFEKVMATEFFGDFALDLLNSGFKPYNKADSLENKIKILNALIADITKKWLPNQSWKKVIDKLESSKNALKKNS